MSNQLPSNKKYKVVIVEDDEPIRNMYKIKLEKAGFEVKTASDGDEGLALCEEFIPDLILLDLRMPIMDGSEMLVKLRQTDWGSPIRVIILTNISKDEAPQELRFLRVDQYIVKAHYTPKQVLEVINEVLS